MSGGVVQQDVDKPEEIASMHMGFWSSRRVLLEILPLIPAIILLLCARGRSRGRFCSRLTCG